MNLDSIEANTNEQTKQQHRYHQRRCYICKNKNVPANIQEIGPYLIHKKHPDLVLICPCLHRAHPACLKDLGTDYICNICNSIYRSKVYIPIAQFLCFLCHIFSLGSVIGLVFGLSHLGRALDELGLGSEIGPKLDGDETWQDHEMRDIVEWLNIVHFATGAAGEALLGLVYIVGVCLVIGLDRTLAMVASILYIKLEKLKSLPKWISMFFIYVALFVLGIVLGTYLLFFSWIWASVLRQIRMHILNYKNQQDQ